MRRRALGRWLSASERCKLSSKNPQKMTRKIGSTSRVCLLSNVDRDSLKMKKLRKTSGRTIDSKMASRRL